jgi:hypothetical protein
MVVRGEAVFSAAVRESVGGAALRWWLFWRASKTAETQPSPDHGRPAFEEAMRRIALVAQGIFGRVGQELGGC